jgi:O-antigen ligase
MGDFTDFRWILGLYLIAIATIAAEFDDSLNLNLASYLGIGIIVLAFIYDFYATGSFPNSINRFKAFYVNPNVCGMAFTIYATFLLGWVSTKVYLSQSLPKIPFLASVLILFSIYLTYSRSSWMGIFSAVLLITILYRTNRYIFLSAISSIVMISGAYIFNILGFKDRILYTTNLTSSSGTVRLDIWKANISMFLDHPIFGVGYWQNTRLLKFYASGVPQADITAHAHNQYLQFLSGSGILGLFCYLLLIFISYNFFIYNYRINKASVAKAVSFCAILIITAYAITSLTDSPMDSRESRNFLMVAMGFCVGIVLNYRLKYSSISPNKREL